MSQNGFRPHFKYSIYDTGIHPFYALHQSQAPTRVPTVPNSHSPSSFSTCTISPFCTVISLLSIPSKLAITRPRLFVVAPSNDGMC